MSTTYLDKVRVQNFRLLADIEVNLEEVSTLVVGRNNSGKTSLYEVLRRFLEDRGKGFKIEDFSTASHKRFCEAAKAYNDGETEEKIRQLLPYIRLSLTFKYDPNVPDYGALAPLIVDLDPKADEAMAILEYGLKDGRIADFFNDVPKCLDDLKDVESYFKVLGEHIPELYTISMWAEDCLLYTSPSPRD